MSENLSLKINNVSKKYRLGQIGGESLQQDLKSWWYKKLKKDDPNLKIGADISTTGKEFYALKNICLNVSKGDVIGILGRNGAGKSTLLKLISRITAPSEGSIEIWGRVASMLEVGTGFHQEMTGRENVYLNGAILGMTKAEIDKKMDSIVEFSEIGQFIDTPVKRYSSGMYVKLAFSVASHLDSEIMIMDEVLAVGDVSFQNKCIRKMREEAEKGGRTILYVSHNMDTVRKLCKKSIVLNKGRLVYEGAVEDGIQKYILAKNRMGLFYDLSLERRESYIDGSQFMESVEIQKNSVDSDEDLIFRIKALSKKRQNSVRLRMEVMTPEETVVGSSFSNPFCVSEGSEYSIEAKMPVKNLAPGRYNATLLLCQLDDSGNDCLSDRVECAFSFDVEGNGINWHGRYWGNARFDDIAVKKY